MRPSRVFSQAAAWAMLVCGLSSATAQASDTPPAGITCSGVMTFISGPQTSLQCSSNLLLQYGLLQATDSITIHAVDSIHMGKDMVLQANSIFLTSPTIVVDGFLEGAPSGQIVLASPNLSGDHIVNGAINASITITPGVPEASTTEMTLLGLLTLLAWQGQRRIWPVKTCQNITQSPMKL